MGARIQLGTVFRVCVLVALALVLVRSGTARTATMTASIVSSNPNFELLAVDPSGEAWGVATANRNQLWQSSDEGASWTVVTGWNTAIGRRPWYVTPLADGTLLAAYDTTDSHFSLARSADGGATWAPVLHLPCIAPDCTVRYLTLGPKSITAGDGYVFLGTYNNAPAQANTNYIYRSADDGVTWSVVNTSTAFRHFHGLDFDPSRHRLYALSGDSAGDGVWYSTDDGGTLQPLCTDYRCTAIESITSNSSLVFGTDNPGSANHIVKLDASTGGYTDLNTINYPAYSAGRSGGTLLVAETHEAGTAIPTPQLRVYGSGDNGATWITLYSFTIPGSGDYELHISDPFPNGDVAIDLAGQGTAVLRIDPTGANPAPVNTTPPTTSGLTQQAQTLSTTNGSWTNSPTSFAYQWRRCDSSGANCADIPLGTGSSYTLQAADVGSTLRVLVTGMNASGSSVATSAATGVVTGGPLPPTNTALPSISGTAKQGQTLTITAGMWVNNPASLAYQWQRCSSAGDSCADIPSATSASYTAQAADVGGTLRVQVVATNGGGSAEADSYPTAIIAAAAGSGGSGGSGGGGGSSGSGGSSSSSRVAAPGTSAPPAITGLARLHETVTASAGSWTGSPNAFAYGWSRCDAAGANCAAITGATAGTLVLQPADVGSTLRVTVTASNAGGAGSATSQPTARVAGLPPVDLARPRITGAPRVGAMLSAGGDLWSAAPTKRAYVWLRCGSLGGRCKVIPGAAGRTYRVRVADLHHALRVSVAVTNESGEARVVSIATAAVRPRAT